MREHSFISDLRTFGDLKVWSFLATLFGDLALEEGTELTGPFLSNVCGRIGIKPEALRVALFRLRKDGWIESRRDGRISRYSMTQKARHETRLVSEHIYDRDLKVPDTVYALTLPGDVTAAIGFPVTRRTVLSTEPAPDAMVCVLQVDTLPDWFSRQLTSVSQQKDYASLMSLLAAQYPPGSLSYADQISARLLVLHNWRRIALRHHPLAAALMGDKWVGAECRHQVSNWLRALPRPDNFEAGP